jgi:uncharacterized membrane protein (UPF0127 family)
MRRVLHAKTLTDKTLGLSLFPNLTEEEFAQFDYDELTFHPYWNKNVNYPIDIGFYDENKRLIHKTSMDADQRALVYSPSPYRYVIETRKGCLKDEFAF